MKIEVEEFGYVLKAKTVELPDGQGMGSEKREVIKYTGEGEVWWGGGQELGFGHIEFEMVLGHLREMSSTRSDMWVWGYGEISELEVRYLQAIDL